jgi:site-specific DNA-methyltransferase (adenine-specific)
MSKVELFHGDCLDLIKDIPDGSVDCIITDPPYMSAMQHNGEMTSFADCNNLKPFFSTLFKEFSRILSDKGCVYMFCDWRSVSFYLPLSAQFLPVKNLIVWDKKSGPGTFYSYQHELILFSTFNNELRLKGASNVIRSPSFCCGAKKTNGEKVHPTQKPVELIELFLSHTTNVGDTVLDCFMGSGSTGVACVRNGRNFIGMELQEKYFEIAKNRIEDEIKKAENHAECEPFWNLSTGENNIGGINFAKNL